MSNGKCRCDHTWDRVESADSNKPLINSRRKIKAESTPHWRAREDKTDALTVVLRLHLEINTTGITQKLNLSADCTWRAVPRVSPITPAEGLQVPLLRNGMRLGAAKFGWFNALRTSAQNSTADSQTVMRRLAKETSTFA